MANTDPVVDVNAADPSGSGQGHNGVNPPPSAGGAAIPPQLTAIAIAVGLLMIVGGVAAGFLDQKSLLTTMIACTGVAIVLSAFGAQAQGAWRGWTMSGSVAIAVAMFLLLQAYATPAMTYKTGSIGGDIDKLSDLVILDDDPMYQYRDHNAKEIKFILTHNGFRKSNIRVRVTTLDSGRPNSEFTMTAGADVITKAHMGAAFGNNKNIDWDFNLARRVIMENGAVLFKEARSLQDLEVSLLEPQPSSPNILQAFLFSRALAQSPPIAIDPSVFSRLNAEDATVHRSVRENLASLGPLAVSSMMQQLRQGGDSYKTKLGITYALAEIIRRSPTDETRQAVSRQLIDADFPVLVQTAQDDDTTIRLQAAEFLYLLQDKRSIPPSISAASKATDATKAADQILIIREAGKGLSANDKLRVIESFDVPGASNDLIRNRDALNKILPWR